MCDRLIEIVIPFALDLPGLSGATQFFPRSRRSAAISSPQSSRERGLHQGWPPASILRAGLAKFFGCRIVALGLGGLEAPSVDRIRC
jgi:hypothetical protein